MHHAIEGWSGLLCRPELERPIAFTLNLEFQVNLACKLPRNRSNARRRTSLNDLIALWVSAHVLRRATGPFHEAGDGREALSPGFRAFSNLLLRHSPPGTAREINVTA